MTLLVEARLVGYHDIDCWALGSGFKSIIIFPVALLVIEGYGEDACSTVAANITHIDIKRHRATQVLRLKSFAQTMMMFDDFFVFDLFVVPLSKWSFNLDHISVLVKLKTGFVVAMLMIWASWVDCELSFIIWLSGEVPPGTGPVFPQVHPVFFVLKRNCDVVPVVHPVSRVFYVLVVAEDCIWFFCFLEDKGSVIKAHFDLISFCA